MKCLTALSNPSLTGHWLVTSHERIWEGITQGKLILYYQPEKDDTVITRTLFGLKLFEEVTVHKETYYENENSKTLKSWESHTYNNVVPLKYFEIALRYILGGVLALGSALVFLPIGYTVELIHCCYKNCQDYKQYIQEMNRRDGI